MAHTHLGWLTLHEVLEATGLPYGRVVELVEEGCLTRAKSGAAELFDPDDVASLVPAVTVE
jgi:hypothetical protein